MHHWIGGKIRNSTSSEELWFSEGFTEYFAHVLMKEQGEISSKQFVKIQKKIYKELKSSKYATLSNKDVYLQASEDETSFEKIPYQRGFLYAVYLDKRIRSHSDNSYNLKSLMLKILDDTSGHHFSNAYFKKVLGQFLSQDEIANFEEFIIKGAPISKNALF